MLFWLNWAGAVPVSTGIEIVFQVLHLQGICASKVEYYEEPQLR